MNLTVFYTLGILLVVIGIMVIVAAIILASADSSKKGKIRGAGVIMIGPIPIIFGTDKKFLKEAVTLAMALMLVVLIVYLVLWLLG